jgi:otoferlin
MNVRCISPNLLRRMYNSNILSKLTEKMEIGLSETSHLIDQEDVKAEVRLRNCLEELASDCQNYIQLTKASITGPGTGKTKLDKERIKLCQREIESIGNMARNLKALVTRSSLKERFKTAHTYLVKLRFLVEDVSIEIYSLLIHADLIPIMLLTSSSNSHNILYPIYSFGLFQMERE